jgi:phage major head subunit gpT-like protein
MMKSFRALTLEAFGKADPQYKKVAMEVPSSTKSQTYGWLGKLPRVREWIGSRVIQNLSAKGYTIENKDWELTIGVDRNDIEDDNLGVYNPLFKELGNEMAIHPDEVVFGLLSDGFSTECYDGQYFYDSDHEGANGASISNVTDLALSPTSYGAARVAMKNLKDEHGKSLRINPSLLVVGPMLEDKAREILFKERLANGEDNIYYKTADLLVIPDLKTDTEWHLLDTTKPIMPIIFQLRKRPEFVTKDNPDDDNVFMNKQFVYGSDSRYNAGYGLYQLAYGSTGTNAGN